MIVCLSGPVGPSRNTGLCEHPPDHAPLVLPPLAAISSRMVCRSCPVRPPRPAPACGRILRLRTHSAPATGRHLIQDRLPVPPCQPTKVQAGLRQGLRLRAADISSISGAGCDLIQNGLPVAARQTIETRAAPGQSLGRRRPALCTDPYHRDSNKQCRYQHTDEPRCDSHDTLPPFVIRRPPHPTIPTASCRLFQSPS